MNMEGLQANATPFSEVILSNPYLAPRNGAGVKASRATCSEFVSNVMGKVFMEFV